jgi:hypothetical protein
MSSVNTLTLCLSDSTSLLVKYYKSHKFELGEMFISNKTVGFMIQPEYSDLVKRFLGVTKGELLFASEEMEKQISRYLPNVQNGIVKKLDSGDFWVQFAKDENTILLQDVLEYDTIDVRHVGWIVNSLYNLSCYLKFRDLTHNYISPATVFISPDKHYIELLGGWWYYEIVGRKLQYLPKVVAKNFTKEILKDKKASHLLDLNAIKDIAKILIDKSSDPSSVLLDFLKIESTGRPDEDWAIWRIYLELAFGKAKYISWDITKDKVYRI